MSETKDILAIKCKNCGAPIGFDIPTQSYRCAYCGTVSRPQTAGSAWRFSDSSKEKNIQEEKVWEMDGTEDEKPEWKVLNAGNWKRIRQEEKVAECSSCGARILFQKDEASEKCEFCGGNLVRGEWKETEDLPEFVLPFVLTEDEARECLMNWVKERRSSRDMRRIKQNIKNVKGYYLPYRLIRGSLEGSAYRNLTGKKYQYRGFLEEAVVNASGQLDNEVLDAAEPFDLSELKPFLYEYVGGHKVKLGDIAPAEIQLRTYGEAEEGYRPYVEKVLHSRDAEIHVDTGEFMYVPILLPMYVLQVGSYLTVVNGQTGKVASASNRKLKESKLWLLEPVLLTAIATLLIGYLFQFDLYPMTLMAVLAGLVFFSIYGDDRNGVLHRIIYSGENSRAHREAGKLILEKEENIFRNPFPSTPMFYEKEGDREVQVEMKFYTPGRLLSVFVKLGILIFLPGLLAMLIHQGVEGLAFEYGAAWYIVTGFIAILYCTRGLRWDIFNHPVLYEVLPDGKRKRFSGWKSRRLSILSLFNLETREKRKELGGIWIGILAFMIFLLLGSTLAIIY